MEILKKDILKEMEEKSQENLDKGIDIAVSILKYDFPFVTGWKYNDKGHYSRHTVYINLICDLEKTSEFYNSPIKKYYKKHGEIDAPYPFFPLELSYEINEDEKYELYTVMQKSFTEIYHEIPDEYRYLITDYFSTDVVTPKEINLEGFDFPAPDKLNENINDEVKQNISVINLILSEISWDGLCEIWVEYNKYGDLYEIRSKTTKSYFEHDEIEKELEYLQKTLISMNIRPYIFTPWYVDDCEDEVKFLNENWYKVPSSDYNSLEKIINLTMKEKYDWWKDIKINTLNYIDDMYGDVQIEAELTVDEEWGANQWKEFFYVSKFPGNKGWEENDEYERVSLGDIIDSWYARLLIEDLKEIFRYALNIETHNFSFRNVYLIFE